MRALRLAELKELLQGPDFAAWWSDVRRATASLEEARSRHAELVSQAELMELRSELAQRAAMDAFSRAGVAEDAAAGAAAEAQALENRALELVGHYEDQRLRTSELWYRAGGAERVLEERRDALAAARGGPPARAAAAESAVGAADRTRRALADEYAVEDAKRARVWAEVEDTWGKAFEKALLASERGDGSRDARREAEKLFMEAEERRLRAKQLRADAAAAAVERAEAERARAELLRAAEARFGCLAGEAFLYFRHPAEQRSAYAVSLHDDAEGHNVEVTSLGVYAVGRARGVAFLEPAREEAATQVEEGERRLDEWLLGPRRGAARPGGAGGDAE